MNKNEIQKEIVDKLDNPSHGILLLSPRMGKTKLGIDIIKKEKPKKVLWVTPNTKLRDEDIPSEFKLWKASLYLKKTDIVCYASLSTVKGTYDKIFLDEIQDLTESNSKPLFDGSIKYKTIIGLTGTLPKHRDKLDLYQKLKLKVLTDMSIDEAVEKSLIAPYNITVIECRLNNKDKDVKAGSTKNPFMQTEYASYTYMSKIIKEKIVRRETVPMFFYLNRMRFIYNLKSKNDFAKRFVNKLKGRTLVFAGSIEKAEYICSDSYHSKTTDEKLKLFLDKKIDRLSCVNAGGVGFTYRDVDNFVIVQADSNMKGQTVQKIARSLVHQKDYIANIYILCVVGTVDEDWKNKVLEEFGKNNVKHVSYKNYE